MHEVLVDAGALVVDLGSLVERLEQHLFFDNDLLGVTVVSFLIEQ